MIKIDQASNSLVFSSPRCPELQNGLSTLDCFGSENLGNSKKPKFKDGSLMDLAGRVEF